MPGRKKTRWRPPPGSKETSWLLAMVILAVALPTIGFLWFVNRAMINERAAVREQALAFEDLHLSAAQTAVEAKIAELAEASDPGRSRGGVPAETLYVTTARRALADSLLMVAPDGTVEYPVLPAHLDELETTEVDEKALSLLDRWHEAGLDDVETLSDLTDAFVENRCREGRDLQGRLIYPNLLLALLDRLAATDPRREEVRAALKAILADARISWPFTQRLFLAESLRRAGGKFQVPAEEALKLAAEVLEHPLQLGRPGVLEPASGPPGTWRLLSRDRRHLLIFREATLRGILESTLPWNAESASELTFVAMPGPLPTERGRRVGPQAPLWHVAFGPETTPLRGVHEQRRALTTAIVCIILALVLIAGTFAIQKFMAQSRATRLRHDFLSTISHELKTPLASTRMLVDTLMDGRVTDTGKTRSYLEVIGRENARLSELVENFLTYSRLESGRMPFDFEPVLPEEVVNHALDALASKLEAEDVRFTVEIEDNLPYVRADEATLTTALINLLDNAHKYTGTQKEIRLEVCRQGDHIRFAVRDNGVGLTALERERVRERFYRVRDQGLKAVNGSGLGLSIVNNIVAAHRGTLLIESLPGQGSVFSLVIPVAGPR